MKTLLVEYSIECPSCGKALNKGDIMYQEGNKVICGYCKMKKIVNIPEGSIAVKINCPLLKCHKCKKEVADYLIKGEFNYPFCKNCVEIINTKQYVPNS